MSIAQLVHLRCLQSPQSRLKETPRFLQDSQQINPSATQAFYIESLKVLNRKKNQEKPRPETHKKATSSQKLLPKKTR